MRECWDKDWRFHRADSPDGRTDAWLSREVDDSSWRMLDVPHDWSVELPRDPQSPGGGLGGFFIDGVGWYRKRLAIPEAWRNKRVAVAFDGVFKNAEIWINGRYVGRHPYGYSSFIVDLSGDLRAGEENLVVVRVDNSAPRHSRWYSGSGIYRHVWLLVRDAVHIADGGIYVTTPEVSAQSAHVRLETRVVNHNNALRAVEVRWKVRESGGKRCGALKATGDIPAGATHAFAGELSIAAPRLWSFNHPSLYDLDVEIHAGGELVDSETQVFGIRSVRFSATEGFILNGEPVKMRGGCVHHDCGPLGAMSIDRAEERKVELLKASGFNAVRCAHNPPAPAFLAACDRLGMLVIDEAFDDWHEGGLPNDYHLVFDEWWQRDLDSMLYRDRNHPSIVLWSIGNEVRERDTPRGAALARRLAQRVRQVDPTRPVTSAVNGVYVDGVWEGKQLDRLNPLFAELDVCGYNYLIDNYEEDHARFPERIIVATETFSAKAYEYWRAVERLPYVVGDFVWTSLDYLGESGIGGSWLAGEEGPAASGGLPGWPWHQAFCGEIDLCGWKRPASYYRDILWGARDTLYLCVHTPVPEGKNVEMTEWSWPDVQSSWTWAGQEGRELKVDVYSACDEVELILNGKSMARKAVSEAGRLMASFAIPYAPGELRAVGYRKAVKVAEQSLKTCGKAQALRLTADRDSILADPNDLSYVTVEAVDARGQMDTNADQVVHFTTSGPGHIAALGSNNPKHTEAYRGNRHRLFRGRCLVVIRPEEQAGNIRLCVQADGLQAKEITIRTLDRSKTGT